MGGTIGHDGPRAVLCSRRGAGSLDLSSVPGPGAYQPLLLQKKAPAYRVPTASRNQADDATSPGPAAYSPQDVVTVSPARCKYIISSSQCGRIGNAKRVGLCLRRNVPGPGEYTIKSTIGGGRRAVLIGRYRTEAPDLVPGPGQYSLDMREQSPSARMGTAKKFGLDGELNRTLPGPGTYEVRRREGSPKYSFGTGKRDNALNLSLGGPGPGDYRLPCKFAELPKYSVRRQKTDDFTYV